MLIKEEIKKGSLHYLRKNVEIYGKIILMENNGDNKYGLLTCSNKKYFLDCNHEILKRISPHLWDSILVKGNLNKKQNSIVVDSVSENTTNQADWDFMPEPRDELSEFSDIQQFFDVIKKGSYLQLEECG